MDGCTDERSLTPPLPKKFITSNGKQLKSLQCDEANPIDNSRSTPMSSIAIKLGLSNYNSTSEDDDMAENHSKSTPKRCESTKSTVINMKNRKSEERDRKHHLDRRNDRDSLSRRKSKERNKRRRDSSKHRSENYKNRMKRSRSKERKDFRSSKDPIKEIPKIRGEMRRTVTEPIIEYCENGRHTSISKRNVVEPKEKIRRTNDSVSSVNALKTYDDEQQQHVSEPIKSRSSKTNKRDKSETKMNIDPVDLDITSEKVDKSNKRDLKTAISYQETTEKIEETIQKPILSKEDENHLKDKSQKSDERMEQLSLTPPLVKLESPIKSDTPPRCDERIDIKSNTPERPIPVKVIHERLSDSKALTQDKLQQYIDEYEFFIQQVSSPLNVPISNDEQNQKQDQDQEDHNQKKEQEQQMNQTIEKSPKIDIFTTMPPKNNRKKSPSPSSSSSSSSSSSDDDDSSSSSSSSSSNDDSDSSDSDSSSSSDSNKSASDSTSSRSSSKSPRPLKTEKCDRKLDTLNFTLGTQNSTESIIKAPFSLSNVNLNISTLQSLDDLLADDDDDLLNSLQSYKKHVHEMKMAKNVAEKSKLDSSTSNDNRTNDSCKDLENGAPLHENERHKLSIKEKSMTSKPQINETNESIVHTEQQTQLDLSKIVQNDKPIADQNNQSEKVSREKSEKSEKSMSTTKKKSSYRKDDRKSRRSEDRKSRRSEDRHRSKRSEDRRSRRSEEKRLKRSEERRSKRSEERHPRRSEDRRSRRSEEKRSRRSEERRQKRRRQSPISPVHYRDSYYSPQYRNRSLSPVPRGPRTPPNTPPPNPTEFDETAIRHMPYTTPIMPPSAHYQPGPSQFSAPNLPSTVPNYVNEYAAYMHPNRMQIPQYNRPPPSINISPGMMASMGSNHEYFYHTSPSQGPLQSHHLTNQSMPPNVFSNLIEVSPYGAPINTNVDHTRKSFDNRRKPTIAVQKGNVLEIVPSADILCDKNNDSTDAMKSDKVSLIDKQHQQALQRQKHERLKRKVERHQIRIERSKRKEFLLAELNRLSHLMIFGEDGKIVKAGEILKSIVFDGTTVKLANSKELEDDEEMEEFYSDPPVYTYDPHAAVQRSCLFSADRNDMEIAKDSNAHKRKGVLFADGIAPGHGTSASENSENDADDTIIIKPKKLSTRTKNKKDRKNHTNLSSLSSESTSLFLDKENIIDAKTKDIEQQQQQQQQQQIVPPPPPGSPPLHLPQPKLKDPTKFTIKQILYFHYDPRFDRMIITETPAHLMPMMMAQPPPKMKTVHIMTPIEGGQPPPQPPQPPQPPFMYKTNNIRQHHSDNKISKSKSSNSYSSYHSSSSSSSYKSQLHPSNDSNLIVFSSSPTNA